MCNFNKSCIIIDGSKGEGGGQILRTSLVLSTLTGTPFRMINIRARRSNPGLQQQHLQSINALKKISNAKVKGNYKGSMEIEYEPGSTQAGEYTFRIETAGSTSLIMHTVFLPLVLVGKRSIVRITGGTHNPWSPTFDFIRFNWCYFMKMLGIDISVKLLKAGFYPEGGGEILAEINPVKKINPLVIKSRGLLRKIEVYSAHTNLRFEVAQRQAKAAEKFLENFSDNISVQIDELESYSKNTTIAITGDFGNTRCCYTALGKKGKRAEKVAEEACIKFLSFLKSNGCIDEYMADQIILPLIFSTGYSEFTISKITNHLITNINTIKNFLNTDIILEGDLHREGKLVIRN